jgi:uncharacterized protein (DUF1697 family)
MSQPRKRTVQHLTYVAFLRAVNVGGTGIVSMAAIKQALDQLGLVDVRTYLNSGNVIFSGPASDEAKMATRIEKAIEQRAGLAANVLVLTRAALKKVVEAIPVGWVDDKQMRCYVLLLWKEVDDQTILSQLPSKPEIEDLKYTPGAVIWRIDRKNLSKSRFTRIIGTPLYKQITIRSANTVRKLSDLAA